MPNDHSTPLQRLFAEAAEKILDSKWITFSQANNWQETLPCPDLSTLPRIALPAFVMNAIGIHKVSLHEQKLTWSLWATDFFNRYKEHINRNMNNMEQHLADELVVWHKYHSEKNEQLPLEKMYREWLGTTGHLTLKEFTKLSIGLHAARQFLEPKYETIKERYGISTGPKLPLTSIPKSLTLRQIALLHIYQDKTISRSEADEIAQNYEHESGEKLYKQYTKHSRTHDRIGVEGRQIKPLVKDIEAIIPFLSESQKQQAEREVNTIKTKI